MILWQYSVIKYGQFAQINNPFFSIKVPQVDCFYGYLNSSNRFSGSSLGLRPRLQSSEPICLVSGALRAQIA